MTPEARSEVPRWASVIVTALVAFCLSLIGVVLIFSASHSEYGPWLAFRQVLWLIIGLGIAYAVTRIPRRHLFEWAWMGYGVGIALLVLTLLVGVQIRGDRSWIDLGLLKIQPSEPMKVLLLLVFSMISQKVTVGELARNRGLIALTGAWALPTALIVLQSDIGTALMYGAFFICWFYLLGAWREGTGLVFVALGGSVGIFAGILRPGILARLRLENVALHSSLEGMSLAFWGVMVGLGLVLVLTPYLQGREISFYEIAGLVCLAVMVGLLLTPALETYQKQRVLAFINPYHSPRGSGYNLIQVQIAIGSGGWLGKGYLQGSQSQLGFIPELPTDFIFSVAVEEMGLLFGLLLCLMLIFLVYSVFSAGVLAPDWRGFYLSGGVGILWILHVALNLGVCVGLMPVIGLPLPFLSYGGSFMVTNWLMVGLLMAVSRRPKGLALLRSAS